jgi:hypothetical protein
MKAAAKLVFILVFIFMSLNGFSQEPNPPVDEEMEVFLLVIAAIFVSGMIGAAIIGATAAALILFFLFGLLSIGVFSTSVLIGLYKRSFASGFKSFLMLLFGFSCSAIGAGGMFLIDAAFDLPGSPALITSIGAGSGLLGGLILAQASYVVSRKVIGIFIGKLQHRQ